MPEIQEAKVEVEEEVKLSDDQVLDNLEQETPSESSPEKKPEETETDKETSEDTTPQKSEEVSKEEEVPKEFHKHPAWQRIMKERDEAKTGLKKFSSKMEEFNKLTSSPTYIRENMKAQGYKDEVIDSKLKELGHDVPVKGTDDLGLIASKLNVDLNTLDDNTKATLNDVAKVTRVILDDWAGKNLPNQLKPLQEGLTQLTQTSSADKMLNEMQSTIKTEGVLDYEKDVAPPLNEWLKTNPQATQQEAYQQFKDLTHQLTVERLKTGKRKETRDTQKSNLRGNRESNVSNLHPKVGDKNVSDDDILDAIGYNE